MYFVIHVECSDGIAVVTMINRERLNVLSKAFIQRLNDQLDHLEADETVKVIILTGCDGIFSAGADIKELAIETARSAKESDFIAAWHRLDKCKKIVLVAINGLAIGGGLELAMQGDLIFIGESAHVGLPEIKLGTLPGGGGTVNLFHMIGYQKTIALCLTGTPLCGKDAEKYGIAYQCVADKLLHKTVMSFAKTIATFPIESLTQIKKALRFTRNNNFNDSISYERHMFYDTLDSANTKEGIAAFIEKRTPNWQS